MKKLTILVMFFCMPAFGQLCGAPPYPPQGCQPQCVCDNNGQCYWLMLCR